MSIPSEVVQERCRGMIEHIKEFPQTFDMGRFMYGTKVDETHPCGTIGCLAGTLVFLEDGPLSGKVTHEEWVVEAQLNVPGRARELLEIDERTAASLWFESDWPPHLGTAGLWATPEDGIKRIEYFMETGK